MSTSEYLIAPVSANEKERLEAVQAAMCSFVPRDERFDRITRMAQRMMHVPIALISIVDDDVQWFRSAQGLSVGQTPRSVSFCGHAIVTNKVLNIQDTHLDERFARNPLVIGPPFIRAYCGWPLEIAPGLRAGTLCVIDTMPRSFRGEDMEIMSDLAHMAESELRVNLMTDRQKRLLLESSRTTRQALLDPETGCWSERGFMELMRRTLIDVQAGKTHAYLVALQALNIDEFGPVLDQAQRQARAMLIAQLTRQRLPANAVLCRTSGGRGAVLLASLDEGELEEQLQRLQQDSHINDAPGLVMSQRLVLKSQAVRLQPNFSTEECGQYFDQAFKLLKQKA